MNSHRASDEGVCARAGGVKRCAESRVSAWASSRRPFFQRVACAVALVLGLAATAVAAPFAKEIAFVQPDGTVLALWGEGDEFYAVFETLDGYTVVYDQAVHAYVYATLSRDGSTLVPSALRVGNGDPATLGVAKHLRMSPEAINAQAQSRFTTWDKAVKNSAAWLQKKQARQAADAAEGELNPLSPPSSTTTGTKIGLCLLIDFSDDTGTVSRASIIDFCNGDSYAGYGNNGSVKKYFQDVSNNLLTYTNVVTVYIRMALPKTYYNDTTQDAGYQANYLIRDAVAIMKALPNYASEIAPTFANLTRDGSGRVVACNVFYAGGNGGVWAYGLWPHSWALEVVGQQTLDTGIYLSDYQITNIGSSLELGTFCHENGHMLCGFPDIYDYNYDSAGGAGAFCLMNSGGNGSNPSQVCAYLKRAAGWTTETLITSQSNGVATLTAAPTANYNRLYRLVKPGTPTEYFLLENRQKTGRDAGLPAAGIAVWHIDELGNRDDQRLLPNSMHANYEVTLEQADNLWHLQYDNNNGDSKDLFYLGNPASGYVNRFADGTGPRAHWWDGSFSLVDFHAFSSAGATMTFEYGTGVYAGPPLDDEPVLTAGTSNTVSWGVAPAPAPLPSGVALTLATASALPVDDTPDTRVRMEAQLPVTAEARAPFPVPSAGGAAASADASSQAIIASPLPPHGVSEAVSIYTNKTIISVWWKSGAGNEVLDFGTSPGGWITKLNISYITSNSTPGTVTLKFYTGTTTASTGTLIKSLSISGLSGSADGVARIYTATVLLGAADQFSLPSGAFGYSYTFDNAVAGPTFATGGAGNPDSFWYNGSLTWFGGTYYASFYMEVLASRQEQVDLSVTSVSIVTPAAVERDPVTVRALIFNPGPSNAPASTAALWFSPANDTNLSDDAGGGDRPVGALAAGASQWVEWYVSLPDMGAGTYNVWPVFEVDSHGVILELNETNNFTQASPISVSDPVTHYEVERAGNPAFASPSSSGWTTQRAWTFTGLVAGQTNWYRVRAGQGPSTNRVVSQWSNVESSIQDNGLIQLANFSFSQGAGSAFTFSAIAGCQYRVRYSDTLLAPLASWPWLTPPADGWRTAAIDGPLWITDTGAPANTNRFYFLDVK